MSFKTEVDEHYGLVKVTVTFNKGRGDGVHSSSIEAESEEVAKNKLLDWLKYQNYSPEDYE